MKICSRCHGSIPQDVLACPRDGGAPLCADEPIGAVLDGRYQILSVLGQGALGVVYRARHVRIRREVAVKVLRRELAADPVQGRRLLREARAMSRLRHPNIAEVTDYGDLPDGRGYLVMELLTGSTLGATLRGGALGVDAVIALGRQMAQGLTAAHEHGIIHRDLRPANIFVEDGTAKIADFGLAWVEGGETLTGGQAMGAPEYVAPEQARGQPADARSDQYALGCVLYEMLSGSPPFVGGTLAQILDRHGREEPAALPGRPAALTAVVQRALRKDPAARFASLRDLAQALALVRRPLRLYLASVDRDRGLRDELEKHLAALEREGLIEIFHEGKVPAGGAIHDEARRRLREAEIVLLLLSPDYLASARSYDDEIAPALALPGATVVPVLLRAADWERGVLGGLKALPAGGKAVAQRRDRDSALREVAVGVRELVAHLRR